MGRDGKAEAGPPDRARTGARHHDERRLARGADRSRVSRRDRRDAGRDQPRSRGNSTRDAVDRGSAGGVEPQPRGGAGGAGDRPRQRVPRCSADPAIRAQRRTLARAGHPSRQVRRIRICGRPRIRAVHTRGRRRGRRARGQSDRAPPGVRTRRPPRQTRRRRVVRRLRQRLHRLGRYAAGGTGSSDGRSARGSRRSGPDRARRFRRDGAQRARCGRGGLWPDRPGRFPPFDRDRRAHARAGRAGAARARQRVRNGASAPGRQERGRNGRPFSR